MRRHAAYIGVIRSTVVAVAIGFAWSPFALAEEPSNPPTPSDQSVQERAVPRTGVGRLPVAPDGGTLIAPSPSAPATGPSGPLPVVGGTFEPDYKYPWVVRMNGCGGVIIDPQCVLTAAHCVTPNIGFRKLTYQRTDPYTGTVSTETRERAQNVGPANNRGVFIHPDFNKPSYADNDIALIKLAQLTHLLEDNRKR